MGKFKVGDKVRVRKDLKPHTYYGKTLFTKYMSQYRGGIYVVAKVIENGDYILSRCAGWHFSDEMLEPVKFTKSDLKNGMIVEYRDGRRRMVLNGFMTGENGYMPLSDFREDLTIIESSKNLDIMKVFDVPEFHGSVCNVIEADAKKLTLLWNREDTVKMTLSEIEEKLGCRIELV